MPVKTPKLSAQKAQETIITWEKALDKTYKSHSSRSIENFSILLIKSTTLRDHPDHKIIEISDPTASKQTGNGRDPTLRNTENTGPQGQLPTHSAAFYRQTSKSQVNVSHLYDTSVTFSKTEPTVPFPWLYKHLYTKTQHCGSCK